MKRKSERTQVIGKLWKRKSDAWNVDFISAQEDACPARERNCMNGDKVFVDTNVLVYAYDIDAGSKHQIAVNIMKDFWRSGLEMLSIQNMQEFFVIVTGKI